jgi:hypothetical protein
VGSEMCIRDRHRRGNITQGKDLQFRKPD